MEHGSDNFDKPDPCSIRVSSVASSILAPVALFVSPHLDDVAFSCSGTLAGLKRRGWRVAVATVFTASVPDPRGFALACQLDKGLGPEVDYMALRRLEDAEFGQELGVDSLRWLGLPEAPHRGYDSPSALFDGVRPDDRVDREIARRLAHLVEDLRPAWIFAPQAIGNHADHLQVVRAILDHPDWRARTAWYRDLPYAAKNPLAAPSPDLPDNIIEVSWPLTPDDLTAKVSASARYASQIPFQFGEAAAIGRTLGGFAESEAVRLEKSGPVEAFLVDPESLSAWIAQNLMPDPAN